MRVVALILTTLALAAQAWESPDKYLPILKKQPPITYAWIAQKTHWFGWDGEVGVPAAEVDGNFHSDSDFFAELIAVDPSQFRRSHILYVDKNYILVDNDPDDGFNRFALLFDKNGTLKEAALIGDRAGNSEWRIERESKYLGFADGSPMPRFVVTDRRWDTEWLVPQEKGYRRLSGRDRYILSVTPQGRFVHEKVPLAKELAEADKKLNALYKKLMKRLSREEAARLREAQRAWLRFVAADCGLDPAEDFQNARLCTLEKTRIRNRRLEELLAKVPE
ncbi:lysozyme inhibitor LprI family protein [Hydrogenimonas sp.]